MYRDYVTIVVRPSTRDKARPLTAFIGGTRIEGCGYTVFAAIEDLFTSAEAERACAQVQRAADSAERQP